MQIQDVFSAYKTDLQQMEIYLEKYLTSEVKLIPEVAHHLAVSRSKVYQLMESNQLPYIKLGRCRRVYWADVHALLATNRIGGSES